MLTVQVSYKIYRRWFKSPLITSHGLWSLREGIILRLVDGESSVGFGEIAPLALFGIEGMAEVVSFCQKFATSAAVAEILEVPDHLPACQFGFEAAWVALKSSLESGGETWLTDTVNKVDDSPEFYSALLPTGKLALEGWRSLWEQGFRTFKWKIGVAPLEDELRVLSALRKALPEAAKLRLDANAGLSYEQAIAYLQVCDDLAIEFLEQPLPVDQFEQMLALSQQFRTPLALDESVATLQQLQTCYQQGWRGIFVVKPAIAGSPTQVRQFCQEHELDVVGSSVFETPIGRQAALRLAIQLNRGNRAVGFGVNHWFNDGLEQLTFEQIWNRL